MNFSTSSCFFPTFIFVKTAGNITRKSLVRSTYFCSYSTTFWDATPYNMVEIYWRFGEKYYLHLQAKKTRQASDYLESSSKRDTLLLLASFLLGLLFNPEKECSTLLWNIGKLLPDYTASHSKRQYFDSHRRKNLNSKGGLLLFANNFFSNNLIGVGWG
jgi:hypothetical protein